MALIYVLDTNVILYHLAGRLFDELPNGSMCVSVISEIEALSYPGLSATEELQIRQFFEELNVIPITSLIRDRTIEIRRRNKLRIPDAIIVATALTLEAKLLTNDTDLPAIEGLTVVRPSVIP
jgi:predicted nucleic acid-binding protein